MVSFARSEVITVGEVGVYHVWTRVVRRAFLCGQDLVSGKDFEYRRDWIHEYMEELAGLVSVEIGFHAEMSNHLHLVLRARPDIVKTWSDEEVVRRSMTIERLMKSKEGKLTKPLLENEVRIKASNKEYVAELRVRLGDISYFMKALCEYIGRRALPGDLEGLNGVSFADFLTLSANFGTDSSSYLDGDIDGSGSVDFADFLTLSANFGASAPYFFYFRISFIPAWVAVRPGYIALGRSADQRRVSLLERQHSYACIGFRDPNLSSTWAVPFAGRFDIFPKPGLLLAAGFFDHIASSELA